MFSCVATTVQIGFEQFHSLDYLEHRRFYLGTLSRIPSGIVDGPIVDPAAEAIYTSVGRDATTTTVAGVRQLKITGGTTSGVGSLAQIGTSSLTTPPRYRNFQRLKLYFDG